MAYLGLFLILAAAQQVSVIMARAAGSRSPEQRAMMMIMTCFVLAAMTFPSAVFSLMGYPLALPMCVVAMMLGVVRVAHGYRPVAAEDQPKG